MKKLLYPFAAIVFAMLPALSCNKESAVKVVDLAKLTADYEAKDGETLSGILGGNYKITIADGGPERGFRHRKPVCVQTVKTN